VTKQNKAGQVSMSITISIMSIFALSMTLGSIQPAMNKIFEFYGEQGIPMTTTMYLTSLPQLVSMAGSLVAGVIAGKFLSFKTAGIIGILLVILGGIAPTFIPGFIILLVTRMIFGIGMGFLMVLGNPLVSAYFYGDKKAKILSIGSFVSFAGAMVMQVFGGILADVSLNFVYLTHFLAGIPFILVLFFLKEPPRDKTRIQKKGKGGMISGRVIFIAVIFGLATLSVMPLYINLSVLVGEVNTLAAVAAAVQVIYSLGNAVGSLSFMTLYKYCKRFSMGIFCIITGIGIIIMLNAHILPLMCIAMFIAGFGYGGLMPVSLMIAGLATKPSQIAFATSVVFIGMNVLGFLATPFAGLIGSLTGDPLTAPIIVGTALILIIGVFLLIVNPFPKKAHKEALLNNNKKLA
jgi:MFS family permease